MRVIVGAKAKAMATMRDEEQGRHPDPAATSATSAAWSPRCAACAIRVNSAVTSETVMSEWGSMKMRKALSNVARDGVAGYAARRPSPHCSSPAR